MLMKKELPTGVENFKEIIENNNFFIDKTLLIEEVTRRGKVTLYTRPRRFGKSLNMSMLSYFFDIENREENRKLFNGLNIEKSPAISHFGKYPIINLTLKDVEGKTFEEMIFKLKDKIYKLYRQYPFLLEFLQDVEKQDFENIYYRRNFELLDLSLVNLTSYLNDYYNKQVLILIDEYDAPITSAMINKYENEAFDFMRIFLGSALKDNPYLYKGVMTGIIRIAKAGVLSGLNNIVVSSVTQSSNEYFGLTEKEVEEALKIYGLEDRFIDVKRWYDGYNFEGKELYNPWSFMNFLEEKKIGEYWSGTSSDEIIKKLLRRLDMSKSNNLSKLINNDKETVRVGIESNITIENIYDSGMIWTYLLHTGYITISEVIDEGNEYRVRVVNEEIRKSLKNLYFSISFGGKTNSLEFVDALIDKNIYMVKNSLENILDVNVSYHDVKSENSYHMLILGICLYLEDKYIVRSNREAGERRYDIAMISRVDKSEGYILEFKKEDPADIAIDQIKEKRYYKELKDMGAKKIICYGISFKDGVDVKMEIV